MATSRILSGSVRAISRKGTKLTPQRSAIVLVSSLKHLKLFKLLLKLTAYAGLESQAEVVPWKAHAVIAVMHFRGHNLEWNYVMRQRSRG